MNLIEFFKEVVKVLQNSDVDYALAGGLVASMYRVNERTTKDLDFLIFSERKTQNIASTIIERFKDGQQIGLNFILPSMPWFDEALKRAQHNMIDFGFGPIPCLTKEDVIVSKLYSLKNDSKRFNDLDDITSIMQAGHTFDMPYICGRMQELKLPIPKSLKDIVPKSMFMISKRVTKGLP